MPPAISIRNLGKRYRVNHAAERAPYRTLRDSLARAAKAPLRRLRGETNGTTEEFWALKDVSFDVQPGEVLGVVGRNGAGKSTLLKILSRVTKPTNGQVEIIGRLGSLLEVGTGFHPELTGRENIFMSGSILGMRRQEVRRKFDDIVAFAGVEMFLDTPVKRYSSGMFVRLGFAVAAHVNPAILLIDEVLSVGDAHFQAKSQEKMAALRNGGTTIVLVSHNLYLVEQFCDNALHLIRGEIHERGQSRDIVANYRYTATLGQNDRRIAKLAYGEPYTKVGNGNATVHNVYIRGGDGREKAVFRTGDVMNVTITYGMPQAMRTGISLVVFRADGLYCYGTNTFAERITLSECTGTHSITVDFPSLCLLPGSYQLSVGIWDERVLVPYDLHERMYDFTVAGPYVGQGCLFLEHSWKRDTDSDTPADTNHNAASCSPAATSPRTEIAE